MRVALLRPVTLPPPPPPPGSYPSDDINKFLWMVRIGGGVFPEIKEPNYLGADGGRGRGWGVGVGGSQGRKVLKSQSALSRAGLGCPLRLGMLLPLSQPPCPLPLPALPRQLPR